MPNSPRHVCLQKTIKEGLRRCVYRRWVAVVKGRTLIAKTTELERMYRGNTPYPTGVSSYTRTAFPTHADAITAMSKKLKAKRAQGYGRCATTLKIYR
jgi:hypothetical protein